MELAVIAQPPPRADEATAWADDGRAMAAVAQGDERAFARLYRDHHAPILRVAVGILDDTAQACDAVQETFLQLWRVAPRWQPRARVRTWLYRVVVNECLSWRRAWLRRLALLERAGREPLAAAPDAHTVVERTAARVLMRAALHTLSPRDRALVVLHVDQELAPREVAALFGMSDKVARVALFRALERLAVATGGPR